MPTTSFTTDIKLNEKEGQDLAKMFKEDKKVVEIKFNSRKKKRVSKFIKNISE